MTTVPFKKRKIHKHIYRSVIMEYEIRANKLPDNYPQQKTFHVVCSECQPQSGYMECGSCDNCCLCMCHENTRQDPRIPFIPMATARIANNTHIYTVLFTHFRISVDNFKVFDPTEIVDQVHLIMKLKQGMLPSYITTPIEDYANMLAYNKGGKPINVEEEIQKNKDFPPLTTPPNSATSSTTTDEHKHPGSCEPLISIPNQLAQAPDEQSRRNIITNYMETRKRKKDKQQ